MEWNQNTYDMWMLFAASMQSQAIWFAGCAFLIWVGFRFTNNIYNDDWLDVRLYTQDKVEHPYNIMWMPNNEYFYVGFHARNTRRLPVDVELKIGYGYADAKAIENKEYIRELIAFGNRN